MSWCPSFASGPRWLQAAKSNLLISLPPPLRSPGSHLLPTAYPPFRKNDSRPKNKHFSDKQSAGPERAENMPKVTQTVRGRTRNVAQFSHLRLCLGPLVHGVSDTPRFKSQLCLKTRWTNQPTRIQCPVNGTG